MTDHCGNNVSQFDTESLESSTSQQNNTVQQQKLLTAQIQHQQALSDVTSASESLIEIKNEIRDLSEQYSTRAAAKQEAPKSKELRSLEEGPGGTKIDDIQLVTLKQRLDTARQIEKILLADLEAATSWATQLQKVIGLYAAAIATPLDGSVSGYPAVNNNTPTNRPPRSARFDSRLLPYFGARTDEDIPAGFQPFRLTESAEDFLHYYDRGVATLQGVDSDWLQWLPNCMNLLKAEWVTHALLQRSPQPTVAEAKVLFLKRFSPYDLRHQYEDMMRTLAKKPQESMLTWVDRFESCRRKAGIAATDPRTIREFLVSIGPTYSLHWIAEARLWRLKSLTPTIPDIQQWAIEMEQSHPSLGPPHDPLRNHRTTGPVHASRSRPSGLICSHHGPQSSHSTAECNYLRNQASTPANIGRLCYHCQGPGHSARHCPLRQTAPRVQTTLPVSAQPRHQTFKPPIPVRAQPIELSAIQVDASCGNATTPEIPPIDSEFSAYPCEPDLPPSDPVRTNSGLRIPLLLDDHRVWALFDTGAARSFVSPAVVHRIGATIQAPPHPVQIQLGQQNHFGTHLGQTSLTVAIHGSACFQHTFEVMNIPEDCYFGRDLLSCSQIRIGPLPTVFADYDAPSTDPIIDQAPPLIDPHDPGTTDVQNHRALLLQKLQPYLDLNQQIPVGSFCTVPEALITLETPTDKCVYVRQYPIAERMKPFFETQIAKWLAAGTIVPAPPNSTWNSPLTTVPKKDPTTGKPSKVDFRVVIDPRPINKLLPDDGYPLPLIPDILDTVGASKATVFASFDLEAAFQQFPVHPDHQLKTTFTYTPTGQRYLFVGCPAGLKHISAVFQRVMTIVLAGCEKFAAHFVDDLFTFASTWDELAIASIAVIQRLNAANLRLNLTKCHIGYESITLLGYVINAHGKHADPRKLTNIHEWQPPTTGKQLASYLGLFNWFRTHFAEASAVVAPLEAIKHHKHLSRVWTTLHEEAFATMKSLMAQPTLLSYPDFSEPFYVATDASGYGLGAILYQTINDTTRYISFQSRCLNSAERNYSATRRELLAIVFALKKFRPWIWGRPFTLLTDHRALTYLFTQSNLNPALSAQLEILVDYDFQLFHVPGLLNVLPDYLSRIYPDRLQPQHRHDPPVILPSYAVEVISDDLLFREEQPDTAAQSCMLREAHAVGHFGRDALLNQVRRAGFTWPTIAADAQKLIASCPDCQRYNIARKGFHPLRSIHAELPMDHIAIDLAGPFPTSLLGNHYLLVVIDIATRYVFLRALPDKRAQTVAQRLYHIFTDVGFPKIIQSDNGLEFVNSIVTELTTQAGIDHRLSTPYHPRANGVAERMVQTSVHAIQKQIQGASKEWDTPLSAIQYAINSKQAALHLSSPFSLFHGRTPDSLRDHTHADSHLKSPVELANRWNYFHSLIYPTISAAVSSRQANTVDNFNSKHHTTASPFPIGSLVAALDATRSGKLSPRYEGPFKVMRITKGGSYVLQDAQGELLGRNYAPSQLKTVSHDSISAGQRFTIESVVDHRGPPDRREYLVRWVNQDRDADSWEPPENFDSPQPLLRYWHRRGLPAPPDLPQRRSPRTALNSVSCPLLPLGGSDVVAQPGSIRDHTGLSNPV
jgi:transposase InsO family protein